jgi:hypothetical protein
MNEAIEGKICGHIPCGCEAELGSDYCSFQCEKAVEETDCMCGHPECQAQA